MTKVYRIIRSNNQDHLDLDNNKGKITINNDRTRVTFNTKLQNQNWEDESGDLIPSGDDIHYQCKTDDYKWDLAMVKGTQESLQYYINNTNNETLKNIAKFVKSEELDIGIDFIFYSVENFDHPEVVSTYGPGKGSGTATFP